jgi:tetratricopeptide (TPR) repeat protein
MRKARRLYIWRRNDTHKRIERVFVLKVLCIFLFALYGGLGCARHTVEKRVEPDERWTCDDTSDEAMKRKDYAAGISLHERFLEREPQNALALYHLGYAYGRTGNHRKEVLFYEKALALGYNSDHIYFNLGMAYGELNYSKKSIRTFKQAIDMNPNSADNHFGLAIACHRSGNNSRAEKEFLAAIKLDPRHMEARLSLSTLYRDQGDIQKATSQLRQLLKIDPNNERARELLETIEKKR